MRVLGREGEGYERERGKLREGRWKGERERERR